MCFKNKFGKLKREDVVDAIGKQEDLLDIEQGKIENLSKKADEFKALAKKETTREGKLYYAKRMASTQRQCNAERSRALFIQKNIDLLERLKSAIDDNEFFAGATAGRFNRMLADQRGLREFLVKTLDTREAAEGVLSGADDVFNDVDGLYEPSESIYGKSQTDDELLALLETEDEIAMEKSIVAQKRKADKE